MSDYDIKLAKVLNERAMEEIRGDDLLYLSSGVVLELMDVSPMLALDVSTQFKMPPVPVIHDEEKEIDIPNPMNEEYIQLCQEVKMEQGNAILDVLIAKGTRISSIPDKFSGPDMDDWLDDVEFLLKHPIDKRPLSRYLAWVKYIACVNQSDFTRLTEKVYARLGVTQESLGQAFLSSE